MKKVVWLIMFLLLCGSVKQVCQADEMTELKDQVARQNMRIQQLEEKLAEFQASTQKNNQVLARHISELGSEAKPELTLSDSLKWIEKIKFSGDFRYRHETIEAEHDGNPDRHRERIRARIGMNADVNDEWSLGFRFATGSSDPVSTNQTLGDGFSSKDFWVDLAYFDFHPSVAEGLKVVGGKIKNPFFNAGKNQLIWDSDLNPEGIACQYKMKLAETDEVFMNGGGFCVTESSSSDADMSMFGVQGGLKHTFDKNTYLTGGISYFDYGNIKDAAVLGDDWGNTAPGNIYANDYDIIELFGEMGTKLGDMPLAIYGNYVENTDAETSGDTGWLAGIQVNKAKDPGSWQFGYEYRELQADAVVGALSDSDFIGGGTNGKGSKFALAYQLAKNIQTALTYFINERSDDDNEYRRLQADIVFKF
ncbi:MAG: putative porin [Sedimentisphaerales bacterium]|nr:putative porin [Sedimentisphaerales bacterium]